MKRQVLSNVLMACLLVIAAVSCAYAAGQPVILTGKVPFAFTVGEVSLPAGDYMFFENANGLIRIRSTNRDECLYWTVSGKSAGNDGKARLLFHQYGDQYFLSEVFNGREDAGRKFTVSKLEKDHIGAASHALAENSQPRDVVIFGTR